MPITKEALQEYLRTYRAHQERHLAGANAAFGAARAIESLIQLMDAPDPEPTPPAAPEANTQA